VMLRGQQQQHQRFTTALVSSMAQSVTSIPRGGQDLLQGSGVLGFPRCSHLGWAETATHLMGYSPDGQARGASL
jgi:hypothetical protein